MLTSAQQPPLRPFLHGLCEDIRMLTSTCQPYGWKIPKSRLRPQVYESQPHRDRTLHQPAHPRNPVLWLLDDRRAIVGFAHEQPVQYSLRPSHVD